MFIINGMGFEYILNNISTITNVIRINQMSRSCIIGCVNCLNSIKWGYEQLRWVMGS